MVSLSMRRATLIGALLLSSIASQAQTYTYHRLNTPAGLFPAALDVTDDGRISGYATNLIQLFGFTYINDVYSKVSVPGYPVAQVTAIGGSNIYGVVNQNNGFVEDSQGKVTILKAPFGALPNGVNAKGVVVGQAKIFQSNNPAFVLQNGTYKTFLYPGSNVTTFNAINNKGVIVGTWNKNGGPLQSFELKNGLTTSITFPFAYSTIVTGINDSGQMIGYYLSVPQAAPALFSFDGVSYTNIPLPANSYACFSAHLNNLGEFVGNCSDSKTFQQYSFLATPAENTEIVLPPQ